MSSWKLKIATVDKTTSLRQIVGGKIGPLNLNDRSGAYFQANVGYLPDQYAEVLAIAQDGTTELYGGVILQRSASGFYPKANPMVVDLTCTDWWFYLDNAPLTSRVYASPVTLKVVLQDLIADCGLTTNYGITLHGSQVTGPTLPAFSWNNTRPSDAIRSLCTSSSSGTTNYVARVSPGKVLRMFVCGTDAAPYGLTDAAPHCEDFVWSDPTITPANTINLICGEGTAATSLDVVSAGVSQDDYAVDYPAYAGSDLTWPSQLIVNAVNQGPVAFGVAATGWYWDPTNHQLVNTHAGGAFEPAASDVVTIGYTIQYPFIATATSGATPPLVATETDTTIRTLTEGNAEAAANLVLRNQSPRTATMTSLDLGWLPGQAVTCDLTHRAVNSTTWTIVTVEIAIITDTFWRYTVTLAETKVFQGNTNDEWRAMGVGAGVSTTPSVSSGGGGGGSTTVLSSPFFLGGTDIAGVTMAGTPVRRPVWSYRLFYASSSFSGLVRASLHARSAAVAVQAILVDVTNPMSEVEVASSSLFTSIARVETSFAATIVASHVYRLDVLADTGGEDAYALGDLEAAA